MAISKWKKSPLKPLCIRIGDGLHGTPTYDENSDVFFINGNNLKNGSIVVSPDTKKVTNSDFESNYIELNDNSLLLSINGTLGEMAFYNGEKVMLGKSAAYLNFKTGINRFYYYYFQLKDVQRYFHNVATGSTIKNLGLKSIQDFEVPYPEEKEWKPIARVLANLDKKIDLNNKINTELETMTKLIYNYWFVQFDFPDANGKPYKSSGGKMVWNESLKREIPDGWSLINLSKIVNIYDSKRVPLSNRQREKMKGIYPYYGATSIMDYINDYIFDGEYILLGEDGSVMDEYGFPIVQYIWGKTWVNNHAHVLQPKNILNTEYLFYLLKSISVIQIMTGSIQKKINQDNLMHVKVAFPNETSLKLFSEFATPVRKRIICIAEENKKLVELRDWLLPMLMNGQVTVKDA